MRTSRSRFEGWRSFICGWLTTGLSIAALMAVPKPAAAQPQLAYVLADQPSTAAYTPPSWAAYDGGNEVRVSRWRMGRYHVRLGTVLARGNVQVAAWSPYSGSCQLAYWNDTGVEVACYGPDGALADRRFSLLAVNGSGAAYVAYTLAPQPSPDFTSYAAAPGRTYSDVVPTISRLAPGTYSVTLSNRVVVAGANLQVTAYGSSLRRCRLSGFSAGDGSVGVLCTDGAGVLADSAFSVLALKPAPSERRLAFALADQPLARAPYPPRDAQSPDGVPSVERTGVGRYLVTLGGKIANVQTTAFGGDGYCHPMVWLGGVATVTCFDRAGAAVDSQFSILAVGELACITPATVLAPDDVVTAIRVRIRTGGADLRGNSHVLLQLGLPVYFERSLNGGAGWGQDSIHTVTLEVPGRPTAAQIAWLGLRFHSGDCPGCTTDYWNLEWLDVELVTNRGPRRFLYRGGTPFLHFGGKLDHWWQPTLTTGYCPARPPAAG